jgi:hypothetical protein
MKIKPPLLSVLDPQRHQECADALEPYIYAQRRISDNAHTPSRDAGFGKISGASLAACFGLRDGCQPPSTFSTSFIVMPGRPYCAADGARGLRIEPRDE